MKSVLIAGMALVAVAATPAEAIILLNFNFGGPALGADVASKVATGPGTTTLTATARKFSVAPRALTALSQTLDRNAAANSPVYTLRATAPGIGVSGGASTDQLDTNNAGTATNPLREGILFTSNLVGFKLRGLKLSFVDSDDTLQLFGVGASGNLIDFGYSGVIRANTVGSSLGGAATGVNTTANNGTVVLTLNSPTANFQRYLLTTRVGGDTSFMNTFGQGYRVDGVMGSVPEPTTWALLIVGFGFVGAAARRRRQSLAVA